MNGDQIDPTHDLELAVEEAKRRREALDELRADETTAAKVLDKRREAVLEGERALAAAQAKVKARAAALVGGGK